MADIKISALPAATTPLAGTEVLPIVQSGITAQVAVSNLTAGRAVSVSSLASTGAITGGAVSVSSLASTGAITGTSIAASTVLQMPDGVVGTPGLRVGTSSTTGLFSSGDNTLRVAVSGTQVALFNSTGMQGVRASTVQVFTSSGTYTPPTGLVYANVYSKAGGGSGGGSTSTGRGGGGGEGQEAWRLVTAATIGASQTVTVGAAAVGIALNTNSTGNTGATTSFGSIVTTIGGSGGASGVVGGTGGRGGTGGAGGNYAMSGAVGQAGADSDTGLVAASGSGGGKGGGILTVAGVANSGGGGAGGSIAVASTAGGTGIVVVYEYY